jgi:hypothetical protein
LTNGTTDNALNNGQRKLCPALLISSQETDLISSQINIQLLADFRPDEKEISAKTAHASGTAIGTIWPFVVVLSASACTDMTIIRLQPFLCSADTPSACVVLFNARPQSALLCDDKSQSA